MRHGVRHLLPLPTASLRLFERTAWRVSLIGLFATGALACGPDATAAATPSDTTLHIHASATSRTELGVEEWRLEPGGVQGYDANDRVVAEFGRQGRATGDSQLARYVIRQKTHVANLMLSLDKEGRVTVLDSSVDETLARTLELLMADLQAVAGSATSTASLASGTRQSVRPLDLVNDRPVALVDACSQSILAAHAAAANVPRRCRLSPRQIAELCPYDVPGAGGECSMAYISSCDDAEIWRDNTAREAFHQCAERAAASGLENPGLLPQCPPERCGYSFP